MSPSNITVLNSRMLFELSNDVFRPLIASQNPPFDKSEGLLPIFQDLGYLLYK